MNMLKNECIIMLGTSLNTKGGISSVIRSYMETDLFQKWNIVYISTHIDGILTKKIFYAAKSLMQFIFFLTVKKVKLVHVHSASNASFYRKSIFILLAHLFGIKVVFHLHGGGFIKFYHDNKWYLLGRYIEHVLFSVEKIIVLSDEWKYNLIEIDVVANKIVVVTNPVPSAKLLNLNREVTGKIIIFLGLLTEDKGIYDLLRAISVVKKQIPGVVLRVGGVGETDKVVALSEVLGLGRSVELLGWIDEREKERLFASASLFVLPSYYEGVPISILESMAIGVPVIATNVGGIPSIIKNGFNGILVEPGEVDSLAHSIILLLECNKEREYIARNAKDAIKNNYLPGKIAKSIELIYNELLS